MSKLKRRHRKQCVHHLDGYYSTNNCVLIERQKRGSWVYVKCIGVNCGHFAKPVKW